jgi:hypothetical protein
MLPTIPELKLGDDRPASDFPRHTLPSKPDAAARVGDRLVFLQCSQPEQRCSESLRLALLSCLEGVHTLHPLQPELGFFGNLWQLCQNAGLALMLDSEALPAFLGSVPPQALPPAAARHIPDWQAENDPPLPDALLVSCTADTLTEVLSLCLQQGLDQVQVIGMFASGEVGIEVV